jgi:hypothetical protein
MNITSYKASPYNTHKPAMVPKFRGGSSDGTSPSPQDEADVLSYMIDWQGRLGQKYFDNAAQMDPEEREALAAAHDELQEEILRRSGHTNPGGQE